MTRWLPCRRCGEWFPDDHLAAHLAADHGDLTPPDLTYRRWPFPPPTCPDDFEADRESARVESARIDRNESRLP